MPKQRKILVISSIILCLILLTACWDQRLLKDLKLVFIVGFDKGENDEILSSIAIRGSKKLSTGGTSGEATVAIVEGSGITLRDTRLELDRKIPGEFSPSKTRVYLLGEALAREDLYTIFDILYRDPRAPLGAKLAIVRDGDAANIIRMKTIKETLLTEAIQNLLENAEQRTLISNETVQSICPTMFDPASDFHLPVIQKAGSHDIEVSGLGLISDRNYTGVTLNPIESTLLLLLEGKKGKKTQLNLMVHPDEEKVRNRYMTINIGKAKQKMEVAVHSLNNITVSIDLNLTATIVEYPKNDVVDKKVVDQLAKKAATSLEEQAKEIVKTIQLANSDVLSIGEEIKVHHHDSWKKLNWRETYPTIDIQPKVKVKIVGTGIIN